MRQIEFFITPDGRVMVDDRGKGFFEYTQENRDLAVYIKNIIQTQYPTAYTALEKIYEKSKPNVTYFDYLITHRFIRCNFGKFDGLTYDIDDDIMHIEEVACPIRRECPFEHIVCKPHPYGLGKREAEIARMSSAGMTYDEISKKLNISHSTIKNIIQIVRKKMKLLSSKDIAKIFVTTL